jgi:hypothetical protein
MGSDTVTTYIWQGTAATSGCVEVDDYLHAVDETFGAIAAVVCRLSAMSLKVTYA